METLGNIKQKVFRLIEEIDTTSQYLTDDPDLQNKINTVANAIQMELFSIRKSAIKDQISVTKGQEINLKTKYENFYLLKKIEGVKYKIIDNYVTFRENGTATIYYYAFPTPITITSLDTQEIDLEPNVIETMVYGIASDILKSDISANYGQIYNARYQELKANLDGRFTQGTINITGGI